MGECICVPFHPTEPESSLQAAHRWFFNLLQKYDAPSDVRPDAGRVVFFPDDSGVSTACMETRRWHDGRVRSSAVWYCAQLPRTVS